MIQENTSYPKHRQVFDRLCEAIDAGRYVPGRRMPSERKLAEEFAVNITTVRRAFRDLVEADIVRKRVGDGTYVNAETHCSEGKCINFLIPGYNGTLHRELEELAQKQLDFQGRTCRIHHSSQTDLVMQLRTFIRFRQPTVILCDNTVRADVVRELSLAPRLFVAIANRLDHLGVPSVVGNDYAGIGLMISHLRQLNHRRIGLLCNNAGHPTENVQIAVWKSEFPDAPELEFRADVPPGAHPLEYATNCVIRRFRASGATALIALNDELAVGALAAAAELGLRVPEDLSVISVGDSALTRMTNPPLTALNSNLTEHFRQSLILLHENLKLHPQSDLLRIVEPTLTIRKSTTHVL